MRNGLFHRCASSGQKSIIGGLDGSSATRIAQATGRAGMPYNRARREVSANDVPDLRFASAGSLQRGSASARLCSGWACAQRSCWCSGLPHRKRQRGRCAAGATTDAEHREIPGAGRRDSVPTRRMRTGPIGAISDRGPGQRARSLFSERRSLFYSRVEREDFHDGAGVCYAWTRLPISNDDRIEWRAGKRWAAGRRSGFGGAGRSRFSNRKSPYEKGNLKDGAVDKVLAEMADAAVAKGLKRSGWGLVADDSYFPYDPYPAGWNVGDLFFPFGAPVSAIAFNDNTVRSTCGLGQCPAERPRSPCSPAGLRTSLEWTGYCFSEREVGVCGGSAAWNEFFLLRGVDFAGTCADEHRCGDARSG